MGHAASICRNTEILIGCQDTCGLCCCHGGSQATGRAGSKRRSKKDRVTSFARSIVGTQVIIDIGIGLWNEDFSFSTETLATVFVVLPAISHILI